jgi:hypothetical protein
MRFDSDDIGWYEQRLLVLVLLFILGFLGYAADHDPLAAVRTAINAAMPH